MHPQTAVLHDPRSGVLRTLAALLLAFVVLPLWPALAGSAPEIWFAPHGGRPTVPGAADYGTLFRADNPAWVAAAGKFQVFSVNLNHLRSAADSELLVMASDLKSRHIALAIAYDSIGRLPADVCATGEGYESPAAVQAFTARLTKLNIRPDIISMDSPLWFGRYDTRYCRFSVPVLIQRTASTLSLWATAFPGMTYGEIEPWIEVQDNPGWQADFAALKDGIATTTGVRLSFAQTDANIHAHPNWPAQLAMAQAFVHQMGMKYGMIYDGLNTEQSDAQWIANAKARIATVEGQTHVIPDIATIESWDQYPTRVLPATDPTTLSSLLFYYVSLTH